ncbi:MAG: alpha/beta hydrolase [Chloroflexota bacterium]|jgi:pimeloyl-ACP methyl ester carboxylesterase
MALYTGTSVMNTSARPPIEVHHHGPGEPYAAVLHGGPGAPGSAAGLAREAAAFGAVLEPWQRRAGEVPLTVARHVADLAAVLPRPLVLVGWSWGAMLALSCAAARPGLATALVLVGCGTYDEASRQAYEQTMARRLGADGRARMAALRRELAREDRRAARDRLFEELGRIAAQAQAYDPIASDEPDEMGEVDADGFAETWADAMRLQRGGVEPSSFAAIDCPVLMLHGAEDPHPGSATRDVLRRYLSHLEYIEIPRCGHQPWLERHGREPFLDALRRWLGGPGAPGMGSARTIKA